MGPRAYLGISYPAFPNMFFLLGPNTTLGHNSVVFMAECQCDHIIKLLKELAAQQLSYVRVKEKVLESYYDWLREDMNNKVFIAVFLPNFRYPVTDAFIRCGTHASHGTERKLRSRSNIRVQFLM